MTPIDPTLGELVACPECRGPLEIAEQAVSCDPCRKRYPVENGIALLTPEHGRPLR